MNLELTPMKKIIISLLGLIILISGCKKDPLEGYWKMTFTADVTVFHDGSIATGACFHSGYIGAVLYFPVEGGEVVHQESFVTVQTIDCLDCYGEMRSQTANIPITLNAKLDVTSVEIGDAEGNVTAVFDDFRIWMENPTVFSIDIYYDCGGTPDIQPDYGNAVSQLTGPFLNQVWSFSPQFDQLHHSTFEDFAFPPLNVADIEFRMYEEYVEAY